MVSDLEPKIIFEHKDFIVISKPAGLLTHNTKHDHSSLLNFLLLKYPEIKGVGDDRESRPGIVHRLDRDTSGVMLIARNVVGFQNLKNLFLSYGIKKTYKAIVFGGPKLEHGSIDSPIGLTSGSLKRSIRGTRLIKNAITEYLKNEIFKTIYGEFSLLTLKPKTGRTHQLRVHLASIHCPILGDQLYGKSFMKRLKLPFLVVRQMLHAEQIEFTYTNGSSFRFDSSLPLDFENTLEFLRINNDVKLEL